MNNWTIGKKLLAGFGAVFVLLAIVGATALEINSSLRKELDRAIRVNARRELLAGKLSTAAESMVALDRGIAFSLVLQQLDRAKALKGEYQQASRQLREAIDEMSSSHDSEAREDLRFLQSLYGAAEQAHGEFLQLLSGQQMDLALKAFDEKVAPRLKELSARSKTLVDAEEKRLAATATSSDERASRSFWIMSSLFAATLIVSGVVLLVVRKATSTLRELTGEIAVCAAEVSGASSRISDTSRGISELASRQAGSLEETSASSHEMTSLTQKNADASRHAATVMAEVDARVKDANSTLDQMVASMREINGSSEKIAKIIKVIDEISFQTNILALNAAVEAARAGEAGMGFAVVADEVRRLAQRCAQAAKDTASLIEESISTSSEGTRKIEKMASSISSITESAVRVKQLIDELHLSSQEQAQGIDQISTALTELETVTQKSAASAEQSASVSVAMADQARVMNDVVRRLVSLVGEQEARRAA